MSELLRAFRNHQSLAHLLWKEKLMGKKQALVVDATCGKGRDTVFLARELEGKGRLIAIDVQEKAIEISRQYLEEELNASQLERVELKKYCHSEIDSLVKPGSLDLIVYNLGYLPGSDQLLTTEIETTLVSLEAASLLLADQGAISINIYPGHEKGRLEAKGIEEWIQHLNPKVFQLSVTRWPNRAQAPFFVWIQKRIKRRGFACSLRC